MASSQASASTGASQTQSVAQEYIVRVPKVENKKYNVMKFNASLNVDFTKWSQVKMERENNLKEFKIEDDMPKFGAGSEYGRDQREEARKKKYGIISKKYNSEDQPWLLKIGGKAGKKYRGIREGGVTENASYYVFTQAQDGAFEAFPIDEWYNYTPIQTYKTLNAEEAEEEFGRRDKVFNYFSIMLKKRLKNDDPAGEADAEEKEAKKKGQKKGKKSGELKISDMDDWMNSSDDDDEDEEDEKEEKDEKVKNKKKAQQKKNTKKKKKKNESDSEAWEDSDDGDEEGREVDYISDGSSDSEEEPERKAKDEMKGVEDEEAIRKMENSDTSDEDENEEKKNENGEATKEETATTSAAKTEKSSARDKKEKKDAGSSSDTSAESSDSDDFDNDTSFQSAMFMQDRQKGSGSKKGQRKAKKESLALADGTNSRSNTPTKPVDRSGRMKRPLADGDSKESSSSTKRPRSDLPSTSSPMSLDGISEDSIRRYLMRKPMTASELLQKFKSKKTGLSSDQMVNTITQILKRLNPDKQMIKGKMYLSIKQT